MPKKPPGALAIEYRPLNALIPYARNSRTHSDAQVAQIAASIREFGWTNPVLVDEQQTIVAGHGRVLAAQKLGLESVPTITLAGLTDAKRRAYVIADNKLALNAGWDEEMLKVELQELTDAGLDVAMVGFSPEELNVLFNGWQSDIESVEKHGENTDGIGATLKLKVSEESKQLAVQAVTNALDAAGVEYEWA
jgi:ParB-like chromosome segregation protein Spo0J